MGWLTEDSVLPDARRKLADLVSFMASRSRRDSLDRSDSDDIAAAVHGMGTAAASMRKDWFFASIGVMDVLGEDGEETYYLSRSPNSSYFSTHDVVPWTNWVGSVYVEVSEALRRGTYPQRLTYGPGNLNAERPVGPLVNYKFDQGDLTDADFRAFGMAANELATEPQGPDGEFGLRDIVTTIDRDQDRKLRASMSGTFILTGGPGVGKTTIALHRLSYLINEQNAEGEKSVDHYAHRANRFFVPDTMAVVVWKDHLVPYLDSCLRELGLEGVRVQHIEDWVSESLKPHVPFGLSKGQFRLFADPAEIKESKLCCSEQEIENFLFSEHSLLKELRSRYEGLRDEVNQWLTSTGSPAIKLVPPAYFTADEVEGSINSLTDAIDRALAVQERSLKSFSFIQDRPRTQRAYDEGVALRKKVAGRLATERGRIRSSAVRLLMEFYVSPECRSVADGCDNLQAHVQSQAKASRLSHADRYLLLWIMHILGHHDSHALENGSLPLQEYSHIVVDEAQYYHPLLLRLLHGLTKEPRKSMTIVGDLEQRISSDGGLVAWEAAGISVPKENLQRLDTNYRWSKQVFGFLSQFRRAAGLRDSLREPDVWYSREGVRPSVVSCISREQEFEALAQRINQLKTTDDSKRWSIAVVVPFSEGHDAVRGLIDLFQRCDVRARWASGQDLRESKDNVVITSYDSVVGLEFDAVMLPGVDVVLGGLQRDDAMRALWVAVTRARKYEWLSGLAEDAHWSEFFGREEFDHYHEDPEAFFN